MFLEMTKTIVAQVDLLVPSILLPTQPLPIVLIMDLSVVLHIQVVSLEALAVTTQILSTV